ncbi:MAG: haloacid dehalogenase type II [Burkholderiaceae bacterium]
MTKSTPVPTVLAFDVFGTVVDWHGSIAREVEATFPGVNGGDFASAWRAGYKPAMDRVRTGELPWTKIDDLHRMNLDQVLSDFGLDHVDEAQRIHLNKAWHRLDGWPDASAGLTRLRQRFMLCSLSNGNLGLLANMARHARLPWDLVLSAEVFHHYKPDPQAYLGVCDVFDIEPAQMMMVAAHKDDLHAAAATGCRTAFITRPQELGAGKTVDISVEPAFDYHATDFHDLATQLGCD